MKKTTISILAIVMGVSFLCLLALQMRYIEEILSMRKAHFDESVSRSLNQAVHQVEIDEVMNYLEHSGVSYISGIGADTIIYDTKTSDQYFTRNNGASSAKSPRSLQEVMAKRFLYEKDLLDEVIYSILYTTGDKPLEDRVDFKALDSRIKTELTNNGIILPYHFKVTTSNGQTVYQCSDYDEEGSEHIFSETIFKNDQIQKVGIIKIHFPDLADYTYASIWFMLPSLVFTLVLLITFIVTLVLVFRQKKLSELKNDFINNMTHEFKTPISSISLAAQMLGDPSVKKTPQMINRLTTTIQDETKRLRFQVEKVLQMSMYEHQSANLRMTEIDANELIASVIHTFTLKVEKNGGKIISDLQAINPFINADEMHFTNVIFNLMDNAVKYRRSDIELLLKINTWNEDKHVCISIQDNGIGLKKEDLKRIFEKFYRVHTGNIHDVKGFGLGLAYVHKIIKDHKGSIYAESELGIGTKFIIKMPMADIE